MRFINLALKAVLIFWLMVFRVGFADFALQLQSEDNNYILFVPLNN